MTAVLLGERLLEDNLITPQQLAQALEQQRRYGGKIGEILHHWGFCNSLNLHRHLAEQQALPFADLLQHPPNAELLDENSLGEYLFLEALPWRQEADGTTLIATPQPDSQVQSWAARYFPRHRFAITARRDIHRSLNLLFRPLLQRLSIHQLAQLAPHQSAQVTLYARQRHWCAGLGVGLVALLCLFPATTLVLAMLLLNGFYLATLLLKTLLFVQGKQHRHTQWQAAESHQLVEESLPLYTILVPLYDEAKTLPKLLEGLRALDYPRNKLDIKLLLEEDDADTIAAAKALNPEGMFDLLVIPPSLPRTKPKACNYGLRFARGEYVTIYDAEDIPDPQQLRRVLARFAAAPAEVVCVQCRLNYYNRSRNLLTKLFSIEYATWFDYMLPGLEALNLPLPLGGTSNHIHLARLLELGEWDPFNVTEDADLGIRMAVAKYRTLTCESLTAEEAPAALWAWVKQRSRWVKGYLQTWLVHMRHPLRLYRQLGAKAFWGFQFFIGGPCLVFLTTPLMMLIALGWRLGSFHLHHPLQPLIAPLSALVLGYGLVMHLLFAGQVLRDNSNWQGMRGALLAFPFYWLLHSAASFRGLWQLLTRPHYWDKTEHGTE